MCSSYFQSYHLKNSYVSKIFVTVVVFILSNHLDKAYFSRSQEPQVFKNLCVLPIFKAVLLMILMC